MKTFLTLLAFFIICSCQKHKVLSYEEGLDNCNQIQEDKKKENPNVFHSISPDCLHGAQIPVFEGITMAGKTMTSESLKGKISIINFWFTTCAPCVAEIPGFNKIVEKYGADEINYIAIGREYPQDIEAFLKEHPWKFQQLLNGSELIKDNFKIRWGYPTTFLLNKNAEIILAFSGGQSDSTAVEEIQNKLVPVIDKELN